MPLDAFTSLVEMHAEKDEQDLSASGGAWHALLPTDSKSGVATGTDGYLEFKLRLLRIIKPATVESNC